jgi:hypothetical protein
MMYGHGIASPGFCPGTGPVRVPEISPVEDFSASPGGNVADRAESRYVTL